MNTQTLTAEALRQAQRNRRMIEDRSTRHWNELRSLAELDADCDLTPRDKALTALVLAMVGAFTVYAIFAAVVVPVMYATGAI